MPLEAKLKRSYPQRFTLTRLLNKENFNTISVENYDQARSFLDKMIIRLVIYGLNTPVKDSLVILKEIKNHKQNPELLILSSFNWCEIQRELSSIKVSKILIKPIKKENLISTIFNLCNYRSG